MKEELARNTYVAQDCLHLNIHGGSRDFLVRADLTPSDHFGFKYFININTEDMRNVYQSIDHNSPYYYKPFLDAFIPLALDTMTSLSNTKERYEKVKSQIKFTLFKEEPENDRDLNYLH